MCKCSNNTLAGRKVSRTLPIQMQLEKKQLHIYISRESTVNYEHFKSLSNFFLRVQ